MRYARTLLPIYLWEIKVPWQVVSVWHIDGIRARSVVVERVVNREVVDI